MKSNTILNHNFIRNIMGAIIGLIIVALAALLFGAIPVFFHQVFDINIMSILIPIILTFSAISYKKNKN